MSEQKRHDFILRITKSRTQSIKNITEAEGANMLKLTLIAIDKKRAEQVNTTDPSSPTVESPEILNP